MGRCRITLEGIKHYINMLLADQNFDPHVSTIRHLTELLHVCEEGLSGQQEEVEEESKPCPCPDIDNKLFAIVVGCDGSVNANPGTRSSGGYSITYPIHEGIPNYTGVVVHPNTISRKTNNQAEYDAVYNGLTHLQMLGPRPKYHTPIIEIQSDSQLVVNQLNNTFGCNDEILLKKRNSVWEVAEQVELKFGAKIYFKWYPRCSTPELKQANAAAQNALGVNPH